MADRLLDVTHSLNIIGERSAVTEALLEALKEADSKLRGKTAINGKEIGEEGKINRVNIDESGAFVSTDVNDGAVCVSKGIVIVPGIEESLKPYLNLGSQAMTASVAITSQGFQRVLDMAKGKQRGIVTIGLSAEMIALHRRLADIHGGVPGGVSALFYGSLQEAYAKAGLDNGQYPFDGDGMRSVRREGLGTWKDEGLLRGASVIVVAGRVRENISICRGEEKIAPQIDRNGQVLASHHQLVGAKGSLEQAWVIGPGAGFVPPEIAAREIALQARDSIGSRYLNLTRRRKLATVLSQLNT